MKYEATKGVYVSCVRVFGWVWRGIGGVGGLERVLGGVGGFEEVLGGVCGRERVNEHTRLNK